MSNDKSQNLPKTKDLDTMLEEVQVEWDCRDNECPEGWYGVSVDDEGGIIAYFRDEVDAYRYRLDYINRKLNP